MYSPTSKSSYIVSSGFTRLKYPTTSTSSPAYITPVDLVTSPINLTFSKCVS